LGLGGFFNQFPQGILTICGEEGRNLSGGQRQLVGLARALVKKPKILVLDEATAAMDWETEYAVLSIVKSCVQANQASLLLITHQPTLAASMDHLMVLEDGQIKAFGIYYKQRINFLKHINN
jgi:ATP-binding cassette, subfamily C, bacteriocin exporter